MSLLEELNWRYFQESASLCCAARLVSQRVGAIFIIEPYTPGVQPTISASDGVGPHPAHP